MRISGLQEGKGKGAVKADLLSATALVCLAVTTGVLLFAGSSKATERVYANAAARPIEDYEKLEGIRVDSSALCAVGDQLVMPAGRVIVFSSCTSCSLRQADEIRFEKLGTHVSLVFLDSVAKVQSQNLKLPDSAFVFADPEGKAFPSEVYAISPVIATINSAGVISNPRPLLEGDMK